NLQGEIGFDELNEVNAILTINEFDLSGVTEFYGTHLRKALSGKIKGHVNFKGAANNPAIAGELRINDGAFGDFPYEEAFINFGGNKFLLTFHDSWIRNKNRSFHVRGDIDFTRENIFGGMKIQTSERVIVWRGWDIGADEDQEGIALSKQVSDKVTLNAATVKDDSDTDEQVFSQQVSLAYDFSDMQTLSLEATEDDDEELLELRHKFRF
ncbi:hypothetical protein ACFL3D_06770, partial [Candidatus Omnitrophota bacterium]